MRSAGAPREMTVERQSCLNHFGSSISSMSNSRPPGAARLFHQPKEKARFTGEPRRPMDKGTRDNTGAPPLSATWPIFAHSRAVSFQPDGSSGLPALSAM